MCLLSLRAIQRGSKRKHILYKVDVQADLSLCWSHRSYCRFCRALPQILIHLREVDAFSGEAVVLQLFFFPSETVSI